MSDPKGDRPPRTRPKHKRSDPEREAREALANPEFQTAVAQLQSLTPQGEPLFGFHLETKDARDDVPTAERIELEQGAAIIADKEAAIAYVESVKPAVGLSPRMPTGKVKVPATAPSGPSAADGRRQATQPSIRKGGSGSPPPRLMEEPDSPWATDAEAPEAGGTPTIQAGERVEIPRVSKAGAASKREREPSRLRQGIALAAGALVVLVVVGLLVRANRRGEHASDTSESGRASATAPRGVQSAVVGASATAASTTTTNGEASTASAGSPTEAPMGNASATPNVSATPISTSVPSLTATPHATVTAPTPTSTAKAAGTQTAASTIPELAPTALPMSTPSAVPVAPAPTTSPSTHSTASSFGRRLDDH